MTFYDILEQVIGLLQRHGRVTYRTLKRQYGLDDDFLADLQAELIAFASGIMTLYTGNVIACGTNHEGFGPLQDGEFCEIEKFGRMGVRVRDPLKRQWERSVYLGPGSTNQEAVRRERGEVPGGGA